MDLGSARDRRCDADQLVGCRARIRDDKERSARPRARWRRSRKRVIDIEGLQLVFMRKGGKRQPCKRKAKNTNEWHCNLHKPDSIAAAKPLLGRKRRCCIRRWQAVRGKAVIEATVPPALCPRQATKRLRMPRFALLAGRQSWSPQGLNRRGSACNGRIHGGRVSARANPGAQHWEGVSCPKPCTDRGGRVGHHRSAGRKRREELRAKAANTTHR